MEKNFSSEATDSQNQQYGISQLSIIPLRKEPSDRSEIVTQILFGEVFEIVHFSEDKKWIFIRMIIYNYKGWIDFKQSSDISSNYFDEYIINSHPISTDLTSIITDVPHSFPILMGSKLPFLNNGMVDLGNKQVTFNGGKLLPALNNNFKFLEKNLFGFIKSPYLWGGMTHFGIDCSGFILQVFKFSGITMPRDAFEQAEEGQNIEFGKHQPGDLAFFNNPSGKIIHVGVIIDKSKIIHASGEVRIDSINEIGIFNNSIQNYSHKLTFIKRVIDFF